MDIDIDSKLAVTAAARLLPRTDMRHGRPTNPDSHWWYQLRNWRVGESLPREPFKDPVSGAMVIEFRADGCQTLVPPSFNDEIIDKATKKALPGETLAWEKPLGNPAEVDRDELQMAVRQVAAVASLAPHWKDGSRNDSSLALAGWLLKGGLTVETVERLLGALAGTVKANETKVRRVARATAGKIQRGERVTGAGTLIDTFAFPRSVILQVGEWLGLVEDSTFSASSSLPSKWPEPLGPAAYPGLVGEIINTIDPHTEADKAAVLIHFLVMFGNAIGRSAYLRIGADTHHTNLYAVLVGDSSTGKKGSAESEARRLMARADSDWASTRIVSGLSTGEGLIHAVRDAVWGPPTKKKAAKRTTSARRSHLKCEDPDDSICLDPGAADKRLLVVEGEFAKPLRVMNREGNTLSATMRQAWDSGTLRVMTRTSAATATDAHISIIGHITRQELKKQMKEVDVFNGFANRFLWACVKRSKFLPSGGNLTEVELQPLARRLTDLIAAARKIGRVSRSQAADEAWTKNYHQLASPPPGMVGSATGRGCPQVLRLALVYALLDGHAEIDLAHLVAALEVWRFCLDSARYVFGGSTGDSAADRILKAARRSVTGMTREEINDSLGGHKSSAEIDEAIALLVAGGLVRIERVVTGGRDAELVVAL